MPRKYKLDRPIKVGIVLPTSLLGEVRLLLHDPTKGKTKYGALSSLIEQLLRAWVNQTKQRLQSTVQGLSDGNPNPDSGGAGPTKSSDAGPTVAQQ